MISFEEDGGRLVLVYESEQQPVAWIDRKLESYGDHTFFNSFTVTKRDHVKLEDYDLYDNEENVRYFVIGRAEKEYWVIDKRVLGLKYDLLISRSMQLKKSIFVAPRDISIFRKIDDLVEEQIVVGGDRPGAIPEKEFRQLLREFPTSTELTRYTNSRIAQSLAEYFETMSAAERGLIEYFKRRSSRLSSSKPRDRKSIKVASELDLEKYTFIRDQLELMLAKQDAYDELQWQKFVMDLFLLIYPQYIAVLEGVCVKEQYSSPTKITTRKFDLVLINASGCVDLIEIKKPNDSGILSRNVYRDNYIPLKELSGAIMQAEKYIFYLNKAGIEAERGITKKYSAQLPKGLEIRVSSPRSIILCGRDHKFTPQQKTDFEFIRRKYSNVVDIITYDDLLRRLNNLIEMLSKRA